MAYKGRFKPKNPQKYKGDPTKIVYRSLWELKVMRKFDEHPDVIQWQSEEVVIPYLNPVKGKTSRYFPDFVVKKKTKENTIETIMIEVKPKKQTMTPDISKKFKTPTGRVSRRFLNESATYEINKAKWKAAEKYCQQRGWHFILMTEDHIKPLGK